MKKNVCLLLLVILCLTNFSACNNNFEIQEIKIAGWSHTQDNSVVSILGDFEVQIKESYSLRANDENDIISFSVPDENSFIARIKSLNTFKRTEKDRKEKTVYVLLDNNNYYYIRSYCDSSRWRDKYVFQIQNAISFYRIDSDREYVFPLLDLETFSGNYNFSNEQSEAETHKDWDYWLDFYTQIGDDYCEIDQANKKVKLRACLVHEGLTDNYVIELSFITEDGQNKIQAEFIDNE